MGSVISMGTTNQAFASQLHIADFDVCKMPSSVTAGVTWHSSHMVERARCCWGDDEDGIRSSEINIKSA